MSDNLSARGAEPLFDSINMLTQEAVKQVNFDKTEICKILRQYDEDPNKYQVSNENSVVYDAYIINDGENKKYIKGSMVYVLVPSGNYQLKKIILGRYFKDEQVQVSQFNDYQWMESFEIKDGVSVDALRENSSAQSSEEEFDSKPDFSNLYALYDTVCVQTSFNTRFGGTKGDFSEEIETTFSQDNINEQENQGEETLKDIMYKFITQFKKSENGSLIFDLDNNKKIDNDDCVYISLYTFFEDLYPIDDIRIKYIDFLQLGDIYDIDGEIMSKILDESIESIDDIKEQIRDYVYKYQDDIFQYSETSKKYTDFYTETDLIGNASFGIRQIFGNPYYITKNDVFYQYFNIIPNFDWIRDDCKEMQTICKTQGPFDYKGEETKQITFYPKIWFGYKKERKNKVQFYRYNDNNIDYLWFNLYLENEPEKVFNYETTKIPTEIKLITEEDISRNLVSEESPLNQLIAESNTYKSLYDIIIVWQYWKEAIYDSGSKTIIERADWVDIAESSYFDQNSYLHILIDGTTTSQWFTDPVDTNNSTKVRIMIKDANDENFKIISNIIEIPYIYNPQLEQSI